MDDRDNVTVTVAQTRRMLGGPAVMFATVALHLSAPAADRRPGQNPSTGP